MLRPTYVILLSLWVWGMVTGYTWGGMLHVLLVMILAMDLFRVGLFTALDLQPEIL